MTDAVKIISLEQKIKELVGHNANLVKACRKEQAAHLLLKQEVTRLLMNTRTLTVPDYALVPAGRLQALMPLIVEKV